MIARSLIRGLGLSTVMFLLFGPAAATAQQTRSSLVDSAKVLQDDFKERQSIDLLRRALDPSLGAPDSVWSDGVQLLAQLLLSTGQGDEAAAWLRWALRLAPGIRVDSVNRVPALVSAFYAARKFVADGPVDSLARARWEWSTVTAAGGFGDLRIETEPGVRADQFQVMVDGLGFLDPGLARRLAPGTYKVSARGSGIASAEIATEVLPGVTTVIVLRSAQAATVLTAAAESRAVAQVARVDARRLGRSGCGVGFFAGGQGLLLTSYQSIRGADGLTVHLSEGRRVTEDVRVAAYDVAADLAVLATGTRRTDSLVVNASLVSSPSVWVVQYPACGNAPVVAKVDVDSSSPGSIRFADSSPPADQGSLLISEAGAAMALTTAPRTARTLAGARALLELAQRNIAAGRLATVDDVARREKHAMGELALRSSQVGARARVSPLEPWQWPELARVDSLPFTFRGPMGRYLVELLVGDQVQTRREIVVEPGKSAQVAVGPQRRGKFPIVIVSGVAAAAGGLAALLLGGSSPPPPPDVGSISIRLPP